MKIKYYKQIYTLDNIALETILSITVITVNMHSFSTGVSHPGPDKTSFFPSEGITKCFNCYWHDSK